MDEPTSAEMVGPWPILPSPLHVAPSMRADRYMQRVPHPYYYHEKPREPKGEGHASASDSHSGYDPAMCLPWPLPPYYPSSEMPEEKKILWPEGLLRDRPDELERISELGLGKAIDTTLSNPWANKKAYKAREMKLEDLIVTNEGNRVKRFAEEIESYFEVQGRIEQSVKIPDKPIDMSVAAETHRSHNSSYSIQGTTVLTRTISFTIGTPLVPRQSRQVDAIDGIPELLVDSRSTFEKRLDKWVKARCDRSDLGADYQYDDKTNSYCREFLESLGGATHYVSSITLGAMSYKVKSSIRSAAKISQESSVKVPRAVGIKTSATVKRGSLRKRSDEQEIGQIPENGVIQIRSPAEAVIRYSFTPLTNLVSNLELRAHLQRAIQQYFESFKKRGPFHVMSAEPIQIDGKDFLVYWKVKSGQKNADATTTKYMYKVVGTVDAKEASNFFIHPDISDKREMWFFITTDPEEKHTQLDTSAFPRQSICTLLPTTGAITRVTTGATTGATIELTLGPQSIRAITPSREEAKPDVSDVERYVHLCECDGSLVLEARSVVDKKAARFKLIDRLQHTSIPLNASSWLPRTQLGSALVLPGDPYFIQPAFSPKLVTYKRCLALHVIEVPDVPHEATAETSWQNKYRYVFELKRHQKEHKLGSHMMLFALVKGKHT